MQGLKVLSEDSVSLVITWPRSEIADGYIVEGVSQTFEYRPLCRTKKNVCTLKKNDAYVGYRVSYVVKNESVHGKAMIVDSTDVVCLSAESDLITILPLKAYKDQISLSFVSEKHYDLYRLYDEEENLVRETEDCIVLGEFSGKQYYVVGYLKKEDHYEWKGTSKLTDCTPVSVDYPDKPILSIVIPVYNGQDFLPRTMQSILSSVWHEFEIILVNDGSKDETGAVCEWYAANYSCVHVIHQENMGLATARNHGVNQVCGEWLAFVDSDDIIHPYMYKKLYETALAGNFDIAIAQCLMREGYEDSRYVLANKVNQNTIVMNSFQEVMKSRGNQKNIYFMVVWNKIVKTEIARKVKFWDGMLFYEDLAYTIPLYSYIDRFVFVKDAYYVWDKRKQKTVGTVSTETDTRPSGEIWKTWILAYAAPLFLGNKEKNISEVYEYEVLKGLLNKYSQSTFYKPTINVFRGMLKYLVREYDLPVERVTSEDPKLADAWKEIEQSKIQEWDGMGEIPKEYY